MLRKMIRAGLFAALGAMLVFMAYGGVASAVEKEKEKDKDKLPDISEIMKKGHAKTDGYIAKIREAAKGEKWEDATKYAKDLALLGDALGKNKPPKGDAASWEKLTKKYADTTKAVLKATEDKNAKGVTKGLGSIACMECHTAHK